MATIIITGGTGLIGHALARALLEKGHHVIILSRKPAGKLMHENLSYAGWNVQEQTMDPAVIGAADYIIHLAGAGVAEKRWTNKRKQEIISSRIESSKLIVDSLKNFPNKVKAVLSASAIGFYGPDPVIPNPKPFSENAPADDSFLGNTCKQWEESIEPVTQSGIKLVKLRIGIVLSKEGGALKEFLKPLQFGIATILGSGKQIISWIHIDDLVSIFMRAIEDEKMSGVFNAVAPNPVSNKELTLELAKSRGKFFIPFHVPAFILKLMLGEMSIEVLKSATISCNKIQDTGFRFQFPDIRSSLTDLIKRDNHPVN
jgi:uncharacterized protein (TIGR01777 family)